MQPFALFIMVLLIAAVAIYGLNWLFIEVNGGDQSSLYEYKEIRRTASSTIKGYGANISVFYPFDFRSKKTDRDKN